MAHENALDVQNLFPTRDTLAEVIAEGKAQLPITDENVLVALLQLQRNTLLNIMRKPK